jgi:hypothetical protein
LIGQGSSTQIIFGVCVAFIYVKSHEIFMPYVDRQLNIFKLITLWQIYFIFVIAFIAFTKIYDKDDWRFNTVICLIVFFNIPFELLIRYIIPNVRIDKQLRKLTFGESFQDDSNNRL